MASSALVLHDSAVRTTTADSDYYDTPTEDTTHLPAAPYNAPTGGNFEESTTAEVPPPSNLLNPAPDSKKPTLSLLITVTLATIHTFLITLIISTYKTWREYHRMARERDREWREQQVVDGGVRRAQQLRDDELRGLQRWHWIVRKVGWVFGWGSVVAATATYSSVDNSSDNVDIRQRREQRPLPESVAAATSSSTDTSNHDISDQRRGQSPQPEIVAATSPTDNSSSNNHNQQQEEPHPQPESIPIPSSPSPAPEPRPHPPQTTPAIQTSDPNPNPVIPYDPLDYSPPTYALATEPLPPYHESFSSSRSRPPVYTSSHELNPSPQVTIDEMLVRHPRTRRELTDHLRLVLRRMHRYRREAMDMNINTNINDDGNHDIDTDRRIPELDTFRSRADVLQRRVAELRARRDRESEAVLVTGSADVLARVRALLVLEDGAAVLEDGAVGRGTRGVHDRLPLLLDSDGPAARDMGVRPRVSLGERVRSGGLDVDVDMNMLAHSPTRDG